MKFLKLLGILIDYPDDALWQHRDELLASIQQAPLSPVRRTALADFVGALLDCDPLDMQERWLTLFDRGRAMSLLLFEHIHGESRDRGQAMVDLIETYRSRGLELDARELPDYLPLLLEYLSLCPQDEARDWLFHVRHILALLAARAAERGSAHALLFEILCEFAQGQDDLALMRQRAREELRDDTPEAIDKVWEEETIRFGGGVPGDHVSAVPSPRFARQHQPVSQSSMCEVSP